MKYMLFSIMVLNFYFAKSQDSIVINVQFLDASDKESPVPNVRLNIKNESDLLISDQDGNVYLKVPNSKSITLESSHFYYENSVFTLKISNKDTLVYQQYLKPLNVQTENTITVTPEGIPQIIYQSTKLSVADFEILKDGRFVLLAYPKTLNKGSEILLYDGIKVLNRFEVPAVAVKLEKDYRGDVHVICNDRVLALYVDKNKISIANIELDYFSNRIQPIVDTFNNAMLYTDFIWNYPAFNYIKYTIEDSIHDKFVSVIDDFMMEMYRAEYKYVDVRTKLWAKNKELETGVDAQIWVGATVYAGSMYYKPLYAPMFVKEDTLLLFDYYKDLLFKYDLNASLIDSINISHHYNPKQTGWKKTLLQDLITQDIYGVFEKNGYSMIGKVDPQTGEINTLIKLKNRYVDKIEVFNNNVYYVYRPFESIQKRYLYQEKLIK